LIIAAAGALWWSGIRLAIVKSGSMLPTYSVGDIMLTVGPVLREPVVGDIVVSAPVLYGNQLPIIGHRAISEKDGVFTTKGDNNKNKDPWVVPAADVSGIVVGKIPLAWARSTLRSPVFFGLIVSAMIAMFFWPRKTVLARRRVPTSVETDATDIEPPGAEATADASTKPRY